MDSAQVGSEYGHGHQARFHQCGRCVRGDGIGTRSGPRADLHPGFRGTVVARRRPHLRGCLGYASSGDNGLRVPGDGDEQRGLGHQRVQSVTVVVAPTSVTVTGPDSQVVGTTYQASATSYGADVASTYSLASGAPSWLSIDASSGAVSGTIPEGDPPFYGYFVTATDSAGSATSVEQFVAIDSGNTAVDLTASPAGP